MDTKHQSPEAAQDSLTHQPHPPLLFGQRLRTVAIIAFIPGLLFAGIFLTSLSKSPQKQIPPQPSPNPTTAAINPAASDADMANWKTYESKDKYVAYTNDWYTYHFKEGSIIPYSFKYPNDWTNDHSVFYDKEGEKIAELAPGSVALERGQKCFDKIIDYDEQSQGRIEFVSRQNVNIAGLKGAVTVTKGKAAVAMPNFKGKIIEHGDAILYSHTYCLSKDTKAFVIDFEEGESNPDKRKLFDKILFTFRFLDQSDSNTLALLNELRALANKNIQWKDTKRQESYEEYFDQERLIKIKLNGFIQAGTISSTFNVGKNFIDEEKLKAIGWKEYPGIEGTAPGGMLWAYEKNYGEKKRVLILSYQSYGFLKDTDPTSSDATKSTEFSIFISDEF